MDKLGTFGGGQGGGMGGFMQTVLPIGLGVLAASSPAGARGASIITNVMNNARKARRLKDVMAMEQERLGLAKEEAARKARREPYQLEQYKRGPVISTGGGGHKQVYYPGPGQAPQITDINPAYSQTEAYKNEQAQKQEVWKERLGMQTQANMDLASHRQLLNQQLAEFQNSLRLNQPMTQSERQTKYLQIQQMKYRLLNNMLSMEAAMSDSATVDNATLLRKTREVDLLMKPMEDMLFGGGQPPVHDAPPPGFLGRPDGSYVNPNNPNDIWVPPGFKPKKKKRIM